VYGSSCENGCTKSVIFLRDPKTNPVGCIAFFLCDSKEARGGRGTENSFYNPIAQCNVAQHDLFALAGVPIGVQSVYSKKRPP